LSKKIVKALIVATVLTILPVLGNIEMLYAAQVWILFVLGAFGSILQPDYSLSKDKKNSRDAGTEALIIWSVFITQLLAILEAAYMRYPESIKWDTVAFVTLTIMLVGFALRGWAICTLGEYFTMHLAIHEDHKIIRIGPYKYFRHPSYVGAFMTYMGTSIFLHSWISAIVAIIILPFAWMKRMSYEEEMLLDNFGNEYKDYCKDVKRVIPGLW